MGEGADDALERIEDEWEWHERNPEEFPPDDGWEDPYEDWWDPVKDWDIWEE
jgi:hypothetical protein